MHRLYWGLEEKGVYGPSRKSVNLKTEPSGGKVIPGTYLLVLDYQGQKDSVQLQVDLDPRIEMTMENIRTKRELRKNLERKKDLAYRSVEQLKASNKIAKDLKIQAQNIDKTKYEELIKSCDSIQKSVNLLIDDVLGKEDKRQGITSPKTPSNISYLNTAISYVDALTRAPGETERQLISKADAKIDTVIQKINEFYTTEWPEFRAMAEKREMSLFKDYETLK